MRRRHNDPWDQPWVTIAAVIGVIAVIAIAAFFFFGSGNSAGQTPAAGTPAPTGGSPSSPSGVSSVTTINPAAIKEQTTVSVPSEGVFVKVSYLGSFSGEYGVAGAMLTARDSGERIYPIEYTSGTISAKFAKTDSSTKPHDLTVEIWKDGKVLKFGKNASPHGEVSIDYTP